MNFEEMTAEQLIDSLPSTDEDSRWELKSAQLLAQKDELKKALGKQVSAFANSGGGYLVFGVNGVTRALEACQTEFGRQSTADYLSTMVSQSVDHPLTDFRIHRLKTESGDSIFVVAIGDSPAAPHQSREDKHYYYRIHGHSKPAPHFHLELLRNRMTRAVLAIERVDWRFTSFSRAVGDASVRIQFIVTVKNTTLQSVPHWGLHAQLLLENWSWTAMPSGLALHEGVSVQGAQERLLPHEQGVAMFAAECSISSMQYSYKNRAVSDQLERVVMRLKPISHNHIGEPAILDWRDRATVLKLRKQVESDAAALGIGGYGSSH